MKKEKVHVLSHSIELSPSVAWPSVSFLWSAMHEQEFITSFASGIEWAATGAVTLPADLAVPHPNLTR